MTDIPGVIYLQWDGNEDYQGEWDSEVTWCADEINDSDVKYIKASDAMKLLWAVAHGINFVLLERDTHLITELVHAINVRIINDRQGHRLSYNPLKYEGVKIIEWVDD